MKKIIIWGTGKLADKVFSQYKIFDEYDVVAVIDNDVNKQNLGYQNHAVYSPEILKECQVEHVVILNSYYDEIREQIRILDPEKENIVENHFFFYKQSLLKRYSKYMDDTEIKQIIDYLENNDLQVFNYAFVDKYAQLDVEPIFDSQCGMYYVEHQEKKMYFAKYLNTSQKVKNYYRSILIEQDIESPHRYQDDMFHVKEGDVVVDIGVAEGNFSLDVIEKAKKIYMIESEPEWIEALQETFKDYLHKIVLINKFITSSDEGRCVTLDTVINEPIDFIKMDIEGNEWDALIGAKRVIAQSNSIKCAICSYHREFDEILIKDVLKRYGLECTTTSGYMWFPTLPENKGNISTKLSRGIVRGTR